MSSIGYDLARFTARAEGLQEDGEDFSPDLRIIGAGSRVEHYEMSGYLKAIRLATQIGARLRLHCSNRVQSRQRKPPDRRINFGPFRIQRSSLAIALSN
jgi:hypothetical protein